MEFQWEGICKWQVIHFAKVNSILNHQLWYDKSISIFRLEVELFPRKKGYRQEGFYFVLFLYSIKGILYLILSWAIYTFHFDTVHPNRLSLLYSQRHHTLSTQSDLSQLRSTCITQTGLSPVRFHLQRTDGSFSSGISPPAHRLVFLEIPPPAHRLVFLRWDPTSSTKTSLSLVRSHLQHT